LVDRTLKENIVENKRREKVKKKAGKRKQ